MDDFHALTISHIRKRMRKNRMDLDNDMFNQVSYSKWALSELVKYIMENKTNPPIILVEEFAKKLDDYSCLNQETSLMFSIGRDAVLDVLDSLLIGKYRDLK